jgi:hypothetical protein
LLSEKIDEWCNAGAVAIERFDEMQKLGVGNITERIRQLYPGMEACVPTTPATLRGELAVTDSEEWQGRRQARDVGLEARFDAFVKFWNAEWNCLEKGLGPCLKTFKRQRTDDRNLKRKAADHTKTVEEFIDFVGAQIEKKKKPAK